MKNVYVIYDTSVHGTVIATTSMDNAIEKCIQRLNIIGAFCTSFDYEEDYTTIGYRPIDSDREEVIAIMATPFVE